MSPTALAEFESSLPSAGPTSVVIVLDFSESAAGSTGRILEFARAVDAALPAAVTRRFLTLGRGEEIPARSVATLGSVLWERHRHAASVLGPALARAGVRSSTRVLVVGAGPVHDLEEAIDSLPEDTLVLAPVGAPLGSGNGGGSGASDSDLSEVMAALRGLPGPWEVTGPSFVPTVFDRARGEVSFSKGRFRLTIESGDSAGRGPSSPPGFRFLSRAGDDVVATAGDFDGRVCCRILDRTPCRTPVAPGRRTVAPADLANLRHALRKEPVIGPAGQHLPWDTLRVVPTDRRSNGSFLKLPLYDFLNGSGGGFVFLEAQGTGIQVTEPPVEAFQAGPLEVVFATEPRHCRFARFDPVSLRWEEHDGRLETFALVTGGRHAVLR